MVRVSSVLIALFMLPSAATAQLFRNGEGGARPLLARARGRPGSQRRSRLRIGCGHDLRADRRRRPPGGPLTVLMAKAGGPLAIVIVADDEAEALAIARTCPHLSHGGTIVVRRIVPTGASARAP